MAIEARVAVPGTVTMLVLAAAAALLLGTAARARTSYHAPPIHPAVCRVVHVGLGTPHRHVKRIDFLRRAFTPERISEDLELLRRLLDESRCFHTGFDVTCR